MKPNFRLALLALCAIVLPLSAHAGKLVMENGDVITGNVTSVAEGKVTIEPTYADAILVDVAEIVSVEIDEVFEVELADGTQLQGQLGTGPGGEQVLVVDGTPRPVALADIAEATEPEAYFDWSARAEANVAINDGNTDSRQALLFGTGRVKIGDHRHQADVTFRRDENEGVSIQEQDLVNYSYNWLFADPWWVGGTASYERDPVRDLTYRYTGGLLFGRDVLDNATQFLSIAIGSGYSREKIGGIDRDGATGLWQLVYEQDLWGEDVFFFHNHNITYQFYGLNNTIFKSNTGLNFDLVDDLYATISLRYDYETEPAAGQENDDTTLGVGLGYEF